MQVFILVDENNIIRDMATEWENLSPGRAATMTKYLTNRGGTVGDEYNPTEATWTPRPENYPQPTSEQIAAQEREALIQAKMREMAEAELIKAGLLTA